MLTPVAVSVAMVVFVLVVAATRYVSLGSILAAVTIPVFVFIQNTFIRPTANFVPIITAAIAGAALIIFAHRANIGRLLAGTESKLR